MSLEYSLAPQGAWPGDLHTPCNDALFVTVHGQAGLA